MAAVKEHCPSSCVKDSVDPANIYDKIAMSYDATHSSGIDFAEDQFLLSILRRDRAPMHVWDVGCGNGFGLRLCSEAWSNGSYEGFDPSISMLLNAKQRAAGNWHATWSQATAQDLSTRMHAPSVKPDLILLFYCTHFIPNLSVTLRGILNSASNRCRVVIAAPTIHRLSSGRYDLAKLGFSVPNAVPHSMESIRDVAHATNAKSCRVDLCSGMLSRKWAGFMEVESALMSKCRLPLRPDFCFADLEYR